ncbi:MAG: 50S ribosomal protein L24 [Gammaproteobacteria bacterium]|nr:50S ribosomal protein L24 [Gammaproteobacteria bacterium]
MNRSQQIEKNLSTPLHDKFLIGDQVIITTGRSKNSVGTLRKKIRTREGLRYLVSGCNLVIKHQKPDPRTGRPGGRIEIEASVHSSNVAIYNPATKSADKIRYDIENGQKFRKYKSTGERIAHESIRKNKD